MGFIELLKSLVGKKGWDYSERRGRERVSCRIEASMIVGSGMIGVEIKNLSLKGMQLMCLGKVRKGSTVEIRGVKQYNQAEVHGLQCRVEWVKKETPGWLAGVTFLDTPKDIGRSWLYWELRSQGVKVRGQEQKRKSYRVRCLLPARLASSTQNLNARIVNLSPDGALVQTVGELMKEGEVMSITFGPLEDLPKIGLVARIASVHLEGSTTYGVRFMSYNIGTEADLAKYLDFFFKD